MIANDDLSGQAFGGDGPFELRVAREIAHQPKVFDQILQALTFALEVKEPAIATHQRRVVKVSSAIGHELGLPADSIAAIEAAARVHDVGKALVDASLSDLDPLRDHVQLSFGVLSWIEWPWPIARIVLQHKERMDGSGFPSGLSKDDILMEARVLAVADAVDELLAAHPLQPASTVDAALQQISLCRGVLFDPTVIDACLKVFGSADWRTSFQKSGLRYGFRQTDQV